MNVGDTVFLASANLHANEANAYVFEATIAAVVDDKPLFRTASGVRQLYYSETVHQTEADAWAACSIRLAALADRVQAKADEAAAKAAKGAIAVEA